MQVAVIISSGSILTLTFVILKSDPKMSSLFAIGPYPTTFNQVHIFTQHLPTEFTVPLIQ
jgi:hypothetical protein